MTSTGQSLMPSKTVENSQRFHRAIAINTELASQCLRKMANRFLIIDNISLHEHLNQRHVQNCFKRCKFSKGQMALLNSSSPDLSEMDITLLCILLLRTLLHEGVRSNDRKPVEGIRDCRNELMHIPDGKLESDEIFNKTSQHILVIAKTISEEFYKYMNERIREVHDRELVRTISTIDRLEMGESMYMLKLVDAKSDGIEETKDNELLIRLNLTRFARQIGRSVTPTVLLQLVKENDPALAKRLQYNEECQSHEYQISDMVVKLTIEPKYELMKFCKCLRHISAQIADLVENTDTDGQSTLDYLKKEELSKIQDILHKTVQPDKNATITSEELHVIVEEELKFSIEFDLIQQCVVKDFTEVQSDDAYFSFRGLSRKIHESQESEQQLNTHEHSTCTPLYEQTIEDFAEHVASTFRKHKIVDAPFRDAIIEHSLSALTFIELTKEDMEELFTPNLTKTGKDIFGVGMHIVVKKIQKEVTNSFPESETAQLSEVQILRPFDTPVGNTRYKTGIVRPPRGNLLVPAHEFTSVLNDRTASLPNHFIAKRVVRFAAACMNEKQNGTIHFGIEHIGNNEGKITGVSEDCIRLEQLDDDILEAIKCSFRDLAPKAIRCIGPVEIIHLEVGGVVIEVDVVPFSRYVSQDLLCIKYPPKGSQLPKCFTIVKGEIFDIHISENNNMDIQNEYRALWKHREHLEDTRPNAKADTQHLQTKFGKLLTRGNDYVTNHLVPIIILGPNANSAEGKGFGNKICCDRAFSSSAVVLDFDSSSALRESVERDNAMFDIQIAEDHTESFALDEHEQKQLPMWLYCNGYDDNALAPMAYGEWLKERKQGAFNLFTLLRKQIQSGRGILIFLIFDSLKQSLNPILELARHAVLHEFREECLIVSNDEKCVLQLKNEVKSAFGEQTVDRTFIIGLPWSDVCRVMNNVFKQKAEAICRLPSSRGHCDEMTLKERKNLNLTDLCIISGEECIYEADLMDVEERKDKMKKEQEGFYRGNTATWWNFYYNHVGKRYLFADYKQLINDKLSESHGFVEEVVIQHQPGAGGSTIGKHLIWEMSQFNGHPESSCRCCIVKSISRDTARQIEDLRCFKDVESEKPAIILVDNNDAEIDELVEDLISLASRKGRSGVLYYLVIHIQRVEIWQKDNFSNMLKHKLSVSEKNWFEEIYHEMQTSAMNVDTLIAFNCMRKSFNEDYVREITSKLMAGVTTNEIEVLTCLALIRAFENSKPVPQEVFDDMMEALPPISSYRLSSHLQNQRKNQSNPKTTWNVNMTDAMSLLVMSVEIDDIGKWGVSVLSQLLAKAILEYLHTVKNISLETIVNCALEKVQKGMDDKGQASVIFVRIVCSLFKTRLSIQGDKRRDFSELVLALVKEHKVKVGQSAANDRVLQIIERCFNLTNDAMVGQQVARFHLYMKRFDDAERAICRALQLRPKNIYLHHTHGYVYKCMMKNIVDTRPKTEQGIPNEDAAKLVKIAFKGIEVLQKSQRVAIDKRERTLACFELEVTLILKLLVSCERFSAFNESGKSFKMFLNDPTFDENYPALRNVLLLCPLESLRLGKPAQRHLESSLRFLEETKYQLLPKMFSKLELKAKVSDLRRKFSHFYSYGKECSYNRGVGFQHLKQARLECPRELEKRIALAKRNLENPRVRRSKGDLLVYLGTRILQLDNFEKCDNDEFRRLLLLSAHLRGIDAGHSRERSYLESYLYYAILNWPLKGRLRFGELAKPGDYDANIERWKETFRKKYFFNTGKLNVLFLIVDGTPGNDFLRFDSIQSHCIGEGIDDVFSLDIILRQNGYVDGTGQVIKFSAKYPKLGEHTLKIHVLNRAHDLCNRQVTFVLGFTWKGPVALDVREKAREGQPSIRPHKLDE